MDPEERREEALRTRYEAVMDAERDIERRKYLRHRLVSELFDDKEAEVEKPRGSSHRTVSAASTPPSTTPPATTSASHTVTPAGFSGPIGRPEIEPRTLVTLNGEPISSGSEIKVTSSLENETLVEIILSEPDQLTAKSNAVASLRADLEASEATVDILVTALRRIATAGADQHKYPQQNAYEVLRELADLEMIDIGDVPENPGICQRCGNPEHVGLGCIPF